MASNYRTDRNNNPAAFTTAIAEQAGLTAEAYTQGDPFTVDGKTYYTAKLIGDPIAITAHVIDTISFYTQSGVQRWIYIGIPDFIWKMLNDGQKKQVIYFMYQHEGGTDLRPLFA